MRKIFLIPVLLFTLISCNQPNKNKVRNDHILSMDGLDEIKIGMKQPELEKLLNQKFILKNAEAKAEIWVDTTLVNYKGIDVILHFQREFNEDDTFYMFLTGIETKGPSCKTEQGIGIGDSKDKVVNTYEGNSIFMGPDWEIINDSTGVLSKTKYSINVKNEHGNREIIFHMGNKKVSSFEATMIFDHED